MITVVGVAKDAQGIALTVDYKLVNGIEVVAVLVMLFYQVTNKERTAADNVSEVL